MDRVNTASDSGPILLYDGVCGFCNGLVQFMIRHDRRGTLRFAALDSGYARTLLAQHPSLAGIDSVVWVESVGTDDRVFTRSDAALRAAKHLGGPWRLLAPLGLTPRPARDALYDLFARHRYRFFGHYDACPIPPPAVRARFLEVQ